VKEEELDILLLNQKLNPAAQLLPQNPKTPKPQNPSDVK
jgi:hypothetical protein